MLSWASGFFLSITQYGINPTQSPVIFLEEQIFILCMLSVMSLESSTFSPDRGGGRNEA